jgi:hypothetical protein
VSDGKYWMRVTYKSNIKAELLLCFSELSLKFEELFVRSGGILSELLTSFGRIHGGLCTVCDGAGKRVSRCCKEYKK